MHHHDPQHGQRHTRGEHARAQGREAVAVDVTDVCVCVCVCESEYEAEWTLDYYSFVRLVRPLNAPAASEVMTHACMSLV